MRSGVKRDDRMNLIRHRTAGFLRGEALREVVLEDPYLCCDETYHKILVPEKNSKGKGVRKGIYERAIISI